MKLLYTHRPERSRHALLAAKSKGERILRVPVLRLRSLGLDTPEVHGLLDQRSLRSGRRLHMFYFITSTILFFLGLSIIYWVHSQYHMDIAVTPAQVSAPAPLISICVPARNEEKNIRRSSGILPKAS